MKLRTIAIIMLLSGAVAGTSYIQANGQTIAKINESGVFYYHSDHLGSTSAITDEAGEPTAEQNYLPFGEEFNSDLDSRFTGKEFDSDLNLNYFGARYYSPLTGRFLTVDPALQDFSSYAYAGGNPLTRIDPDGMEFKEILTLPDPGPYSHDRLEEWVNGWLSNHRGNAINEARENFRKCAPDAYKKIDESPVPVYISGDLDLLYERWPVLKEEWRADLENPDVHALTSILTSTTESGNPILVIYLKPSAFLTKYDTSASLFHEFFHVEITLSDIKTYKDQSFLGSRHAEEAEVNYKTIRALSRTEKNANIRERSHWKYMANLERGAMKDSLKQLAIEYHKNMLKWGIILYTPRVLFFIDKWGEVNQEII